MRNVAPLWKVALACACMCMLAGFAHAANITIPDLMANALFGGGPLGQAGEDNETEAGTVASQAWDLEGMFLSGNTLTMVGGWNFVLGESGGGDLVHSGPDNRYTSGDIFISLLPAGPAYGTGTTAYTTAGGYGYGYVIDVDWLAGTYVVYSTAPAVPINVVSFVQNSGANPWRRKEDGTGGGTPVASGTFSQTDGTSYGFAGGTHYQVSFDLSWLDAIIGANNTTDAWFHFTQECGNDNLMGFVDDFNPVVAVPEPASFGLLGLGLLALGAARLRAKRA